MPAAPPPSLPLPPPLSGLAKKAEKFITLEHSKCHQKIDEHFAFVCQHAQELTPNQAFQTLLTKPPFVEA